MIWSVRPLWISVRRAMLLLLQPLILLVTVPLLWPLGFIPMVIAVPLFVVFPIAAILGIFGVIGSLRDYIWGTGAFLLGVFRVRFTRGYSTYFQALLDWGTP